MGRKIEMKKIEDNTKCQVTFSKRRMCLMKKAEEVSYSCSVDVLLLAFSPSGRINIYCNRQRMEDLIDRYLDLPVEKRLSHVKNIEEKIAKLQSLGNIRSEEARKHYLNEQIEKLELQIKNCKIEVQLAESNLRDFELNPAQEPSLHQLRWCERNLQQSFNKIKEIKKERQVMENEVAMSFAGSSSFDGQLSEMQFECKYPNNLFDEMLGKGKGKEVAYSYGGAPEPTLQSNALYASTPASYGMHQAGVQETLGGSSSYTWKKNTFDAQLPSSYAMNQPGTGFAGNAPSQVDPNHGYTQQYAQPYASNMDYESLNQASMPWELPESNSLFENLAGESSNFAQNDLSDYLSAFPQSYSNVTATMGDASNCWDIPMLQNQPNMVPNNMDIEVNGEGKGKFNVDENGDTFNEMVVTQPLSVDAPSSDICSFK